MSPQIVPARPEHFAQVGEDIHTGVAFAGVVNGRAVSVAGYFHDRCRLVVYAKITEEGRRWKKHIVRGARMVAQAARASQAPAYAVADKSIPGAAELLEHIGFVRLRDDIYQLRR